MAFNSVSQAYEGLETAHNLREEYLFLPDKVKDVYVVHLLASLADRSVRSAIVFVSRRRTAHLLSLLLSEMDIQAATLHSGIAQGARQAALDR
jgi:ATP-dependent RNA helicase DDX49/DBP8